MVELHFHLLPRLVSSVGKAVDPIYRSRFISPLDSRVAFLHVEQPTRGMLVPWALASLCRPPQRVRWPRQTGT